MSNGQCLGAWHAILTSRTRKKWLADPRPPGKQAIPKGLGPNRHDLPNLPLPLRKLTQLWGGPDEFAGATAELLLDSVG